MTPARPAAYKRLTRPTEAWAHYPCLGPSKSIAVGAKLEGRKAWTPLVIATNRDVAQAIVHELKSRDEYDGPYCRPLSGAEASRLKAMGVLPGFFYPAGCDAGGSCFRHHELRVRREAGHVGSPEIEGAPGITHVHVDTEAADWRPLGHPPGHRTILRMRALAKRPRYMPEKRKAIV